ncbi:MAG TPA: hypothetical protein ENK47_06835 [Euryarchaeota archaeon]|nr:hypothetical protein [Euryarchaeota archaeon]
MNIQTGPFMFMRRGAAPMITEAVESAFPQIFGIIYLKNNLYIFNTGWSKWGYNRYLAQYEKVGFTDRFIQEEGGPNE